MSWREFRFVRKGKADLVWMIKQDGSSYVTRHGQLDGKLQEHSDTPGSKGAEGTQAYVDEVNNCQFHVLREIRKKTENGYIEYIDGVPTQEQISSFSFGNFMPKTFCAYKPQTSITESALTKLHKAGKARYTRKMDGQMHLAVHHTWGWEIYSRRMDLSSDRFPNHIEALKTTPYGKGTILVGEMVCADGGKENFKSIKLMLA